MDCYRNVASSKSDNHNLILNCKHMIDQSWWWLSLIVFTSESEVIRFKSSSIREAGITMGYSFLPSFLYLSLILYTPCSERSLLCFWCNLSYFYGQIHSVFLKFFLHTLILSCRFYYLHKFLCTLFVQLRSSLCLPLCGCFLLSGLGSAALQNALTS